jgi:hypothetical protein
MLGLSCLTVSKWIATFAREKEEKSMVNSKTLLVVLISGKKFS